jgi:transposase
MRPQKPFPPETTDRMERLLKSTESLEEYRRIQSIYLRSRYGFCAEQIAEVVGLQLQTIRNLHSAYLREGEVALHGKGRGGRRQALLSSEAEDELIADFEVDGKLGAIVEVHRVQRAYEEKVGRAVAKSTVYRLLHRHGWRKLAPRPHHPNDNEARIEAFKKTSPGS